MMSCIFVQIAFIYCLYSFNECVINTYAGNYATTYAMKYQEKEIVKNCEHYFVGLQSKDLSKDLNYN